MNMKLRGPALDINSAFVSPKDEYAKYYNAPLLSPIVQEEKKGK